MPKAPKLSRIPKQGKGLWAHCQTWLLKGCIGQGSAGSWLPGKPAAHKVGLLSLGKLKQHFSWNWVAVTGSWLSTDFGRTVVLRSHVKFQQNKLPQTMGVYGRIVRKLGMRRIGEETCSDCHEL